MNNLKIAILIVTLLSVGQISAQDGLALLQTAQGAKQAGFGEAVVSLANQVNGTHYNPANMISIDKFTASFGHTEYWENINLESGFFAAPLTSKVNLHGGIRFAAVNELENRTRATEEPISLFDFHDISFKTGLTYVKSEKLSFGFAFGWFFEKNELWNGSAFNVDLGMHYQASPNIQLGAAVTNLGSSFQLTADGQESSNDISLPTRYSVGGSYQYNKFIGAIDAVIINDDFKLHVGTEAHLHEMFDVRAGYMFNYDSKDFSVGATFTKRNIKIDYAFVPYSNNLGSTHLFNFTFSI
ncbi:MAG TPA: PorV/PorQ family protein [candidate division Zixibacteria bacterium]|nr:PorV/PorQ family protein [candidate division Zixibacteria bacterium]